YHQRCWLYVYRSMKRFNPFTLVLLGSFLVAVFLTAILLVAHQFEPISATQAVSIVLGGSAITFVIFYILFREFIYNRLRMLYRTIRTGKKVNEEVIRINMSEDVIGLAERDSKRWLDQRNIEINELKEQDK